jgi:hypothetical protein
MPRNKVPVSRRALVQRVNRALATQGQQLKSHPGRPGVGARDAGRYFIVTGDAVKRRDVDLVALARKLGVLKPYEQLAEEP